MMIAAGVVALVSKASLFPLFSGDSDETAYIYQARMMVQGHATLPARLHAQFFYPWLFGQHGSRLFSQYQPGFPAVIAVGHVLGNEKIALVIVAMSVIAAVWFLARELEPAAAPYAAAVFLLSPLLIIHSGLYLSYLWTTALLTGAIAGALAGLRTRRPLPYIVSGALFGVAQLTRPVDALIVAFLCTVYVLVRLRKDLPALRSTALWAAVGVAPFVLITLVYNAHLTGQPVQVPDHRGRTARQVRFRAPQARARHTGADLYARQGGQGTLGQLRLGSALDRRRRHRVRAHDRGGWLRRRRSETWLLVAVIACVSRGVLLLVGHDAFGSRFAQRIGSALLGPDLRTARRARRLRPLAARAVVARWRSCSRRSRS